MKKSFCAVFNPRTKNITMYHQEPTLEWLQQHVGGYVEHHIPRPGVEVYCDEDGELKQLPSTVVLLWRGPVKGMEPALVTLRGAVVFVFRRARNQQEAILLLQGTLKGVVVDEDEAATVTWDDNDPDYVM